MHNVTARPMAFLAWGVRGYLELSHHGFVLAAAALAVSVVVAQLVSLRQSAPARVTVGTSAPALALVRNAPIAVTAGSATLVLDSVRLAPIVGHESGAFDALIASLAAPYERAARDAALRADGDGFAIVPALSGIAVDRGDLAKQLVAALYSEGAARTVTIRATSVAPSVTSERLAATRVVGEFATSYPRNVARATNITLAARRFDGQVVLPGESFSFWKRVGDVSYEAGFVDAGAIIGGRSDKAVAGGICQVSTALFNAVARAGYRVDERHAHSYFIERYPLGLDAAVFFPAEDFRWTNDTPDPVLIRASGDDTSVAFRLYGVPNSRVVTFSTAQRNLVLPAADQPADPAYARGYVVRGRDVVVTRSVTSDGVSTQGSWTSHYAPVSGGAAPTLVVR